MEKSFHPLALIQIVGLLKGPGSGPAKSQVGTLVGKSPVQISSCQAASGNTLQFLSPSCEQQETCLPGWVVVLGRMKEERGLLTHPKPAGDWYSE